jgi:hypothetical protein
MSSTRSHASNACADDAPAKTASCLGASLFSRRQVLTDAVDIDNGRLGGAGRVVEAYLQAFEAQAF